MSKIVVAGDFLDLNARIPVEIELSAGDDSFTMHLKIHGKNFVLKELQMGFAVGQATTKFHKLHVDQLVIKGRLLPMVIGERFEWFQTSLRSDAPAIVEGGGQ